MTGTAIFLNGPSSSGKSSIAQLLQASLKTPYMHIGIDSLIQMMPAQLNDWLGGGEETQGFWWKKALDSHGQTIQCIQLGPYAKQVCDGFKAVVVSMLNANLNVIVDEVCVSPGSFESWQKMLSNYTAFYVGVDAPVEVLEAREKERPDRVAGSARAQYELVHRGHSYDLRLDTSKQSLEECVNLIQQCVEKNHV